MLIFLTLLKVCRTPGPTACLKMLNKVHLKKLYLGSIEPAAI